MQPTRDHHLPPDPEAYRHAALRLILDLGIDRVISAGVCDPFPDLPNLSETPAAWGRWLWDDPTAPAGDLVA